MADEAVLEGGYTRVVQQVFRFALPTTKHVFLAGHRIMVQVQSSWFPLYDRNPQNYVENIFFAKPGDYKKATIKIFDGGSAVSFVDCRWCSRPPITALETKAAE